MTPPVLDGDDNPVRHAEQPLDFYVLSFEDGELTRREGTPDDVGRFCPKCRFAVPEVERLRTIAADAAATAREAALAPIRALHVPYFTSISGDRTNHYVLVGAEDLPPGHVCIENDRDQCHEEYGEHSVPACAQCRWPTDDGEAGYLFWPCPTRKLCGDEVADQ